MSLNGASRLARARARGEIRGRLQGRERLATGAQVRRRGRVGGAVGRGVRLTGERRAPATRQRREGEGEDEDLDERRVHLLLSNVPARASARQGGARRDAAAMPARQFAAPEQPVR
jgi:hypothetical protein